MKKRQNNNSNTFYSEDGLKSATCCICGENKPDREFRGLGICNGCIEYIRKIG